MLSSVRFLPRAEPLPAVAVAALAGGVRALAARALRLGDDDLARLSGVAGAETAVLLGPADLLPWFDGALFLGTESGLLWPTWASPSIHPLLLERALRRALPEAPAGPLALLVPSLTQSSQPRVVPVGVARPLSRARLVALAEAA